MTNLGSKFFTMNNGLKVPKIAFGTGSTFFNRADEAGLNWSKALKIGYTHIDTAEMYQTEKGIGVAMEKELKTYSRENLFVTTKVAKNSLGTDLTKKSIEQSLKFLKCDYIDLDLIHNPCEGEHGASERRKQAWKVLEDYVDKGLIKSIGVSNYTRAHIEELLTYARIKPVVNQIELNPYLIDNDIIECCQKNDILLVAYSPLGNGRGLIDEPILKEIGERYNKTPSQILLRWGIDNKWIVVTKSENEGRMKQNLDVFDFEISKEDILKINGLNKMERNFWSPYGTGE